MPCPFLFTYPKRMAAMKKNSKKTIKLYDENAYDQLDYYGVLMKNGRARIDTKRYKKFFNIPDSKIEHRKTVYYIPTKIHRLDYYCNVFRDFLSSLKDEWNREYSRAIKLIKTPTEVESDTVASSLSTGIFEYDEACSIGMMAGIKEIANIDM